MQSWTVWITLSVSCQWEVIMFPPSCPRRSFCTPEQPDPIDVSPVGVKCTVESCYDITHTQITLQRVESRTALPSFTPPRHSCVKHLFTSGSGYTCGWALASLVKPKRWPGILSFDPCLKCGLESRLQPHDWVFLFKSPRKKCKITNLRNKSPPCLKASFLYATKREIL